MSIRKSALAAAVLVLIGATGVFAQKPPTTRPARPPVTLHVGDAAPPVRVRAWLKGTPPASLTDGKVHVIEFWATWCGWCIEDMPHLSALAKKYDGQVVVSSINIWEGEHDGRPAEGFHGADPRVDKKTRAEAFVERADDMMAYNVGVGDEAETMGNTWARAAGLRGIPAAFVVDGQGKIAWIGHPAIDMEDVIDAVVHGTYDAARAKAIAAKWADNTARIPALTARLKQLFDGGQYAEALAANDALAAANPVGDADQCEAKYAILTHTDPAAATRFAQGLLEQSANAPSLLSGLGMAIVSGNGNYAIAGKPDNALGLRLLKASTRCQEPRWPTLQGIATASFALGDVKTAVNYQAMAVDKMDVLLAEVPSAAKYVADSHQRLEHYRVAAAPLN